MLLVIDNYDSFVFNLARYFHRLGQETTVVRNDEIDVAAIRKLNPSGIILSPGPCTPSEAGCCLEVVRAFHNQIPMLGVCLGHQTIAAALGGEVIRAPQPMHGRTSPIHHTGQGIFAEVPNPLTVCRYHSLVVSEDTLPGCLEVTARTEDNVIMAMEHRTCPVLGLQFHPEAILTEAGYQLLSAWLMRAGLPTPEKIPSMQEELPADKDIPGNSTPNVPVTF